MASFSTSTLLKKADTLLEEFPQKIIRYIAMDYTLRNDVHNDFFLLRNELARREDKYRGQPELVAELDKAVDRLTQALTAMDFANMAIMRAEAIPAM